MLGGYLLALLLTIVIEGCIAWLIGLRKREYLFALVAINVITHVSLNYLLALLGSLGIAVSLIFVTILEMLVVIVEWQLFVYTFGNPRRRFLLTSLLGNAASFLAGIFLFWR